MTNPIESNSIKTEIQEIPKNNPNLPHVETYGEFRNIMTNQKGEALYTPVNTIDDIIVASEKNWNPNTPETNIYTIQKNQQTDKGDITVSLCNVTGDLKLQRFLEQYIRHDILQYQQTVQINIQENNGKMELFMITQQELSSLADQVTSFAYTKEGVKEYFNKTTTLLKEINRDYDTLLKEIKQRQKNRNKTTVLEKNMLQLFEHKYNKDTTNIQQLTNTINNLGREYKQGANQDTWEKNTKSSYLQLLKYRDEVNKMSGVLRSEAAQNNFVDNPDTYMDIPVETVQDAAFVNDIYDTMSKERFKINALLIDTQLKQITDKDGQTLQIYLTKALSDDTVTQEPFVPSKQWENDYKNILKTYPQLQKWIQTTAKNETKKEPSITKKEFETLTKKEITEQERRTMQANPQEKPLGWMEAALPQQYIDMIETSNLDPNTQKKLKNFSGFVVIAGLIALGITAFNKTRKQEKGRGRRAGSMTALLGAMYVGGGSINKLSQQIPKRFGSDSYDPKAGKVEQIYGTGLANTNTLFAGMTYRNINQYITTDSDGILKLDYDQMELYLQSNPDNMDNIQARQQSLETLRKTDKYNLFHLTFKDGLGITKETLEDEANGEKTYEVVAEQSIKRIATINEFMNTQGYDKRSTQGQEKLTSYIREGKGDLETFAQMGIFEKNNSLIENDDLRTNINQLETITSEKEKNDLYKAANTVYTELKEQNQYNGTFNFREEKGILYLETYNKKTAIDSQTKTLGNIALYTDYQLLKAANLTNRLQDIFAGKATDDEPFNKSGVRGNIEFEHKKTFVINNLKFWQAETREGLIDTKAVSGGLGGSLTQIAPTLEEQKDAYIAYLNTLQGRKKIT